MCSLSSTGASGWLLQRGGGGRDSGHTGGSGPEWPTHGTSELGPDPEQRAPGSGRPGSARPPHPFCGLCPWKGQRASFLSALSGRAVLVFFLVLLDKKCVTMYEPPKIGSTKDKNLT